MSMINNSRKIGWSGWILLFFALTVFSSRGLAVSVVTEKQSAASLLAQYATLSDRLDHNQFQRKLYLNSSESSDGTKGDIYALVDYSFATVSAALNSPSRWCDVMILHVNTKNCRASTDKITTFLTVSIGTKKFQLLEDTYPIEFSYRVIAATPNYLEIQLSAEKGPLSTSNYRIQLQAVPLENGWTFLHFTYSYAYGLAGRLAMKAYLATIGRGKVGFTITGLEANGEPEYIGGVRGVVERNTMRYYLAIDAYLAAIATPPPLQFQKRLQIWFAGTEQYPRQLHDVEKADYFDMKLREYRRQQKPQ